MHQAYMHHGNMHLGYMHHRYMHHGYMRHRYIHHVLFNMIYNVFSDCQTAVSLYYSLQIIHQLYQLILVCTFQSFSDLQHIQR